MRITRQAVKKTPAKSSDAPLNESIEARIEQLQSMLQDNLRDMSGDKAEQMARNIWLAGLGAYSKTYEELSERYDDVQDRYDEINAEGQKLFEQLVDRGRELQGEIEGAVSRQKLSLEERVEEFKERFGGGLSSFVDIPSRLRDAAERIEEFSERMKKKD